MTTQKQEPKRPAAPITPRANLPSLPDKADTAELMDILDRAATYFWQCSAALQRLCEMDASERRLCGNYDELLNASRLGMAAARQLQEQASARLEIIAAYPAKWAAWPERRATPRLDL